MDGNMADVKIAGAVMAGGRSSRMAGRHKGMLLTPASIFLTGIRHRCRRKDA